MARSRASAKAAGTSFETLVARHLAATLDDDRIERRTKSGNKDRGDIAGLRHMGGRVVIECKNVTKLELGTWVREADIERGNDDALAGIVVHKRRGTTNPNEQYVTTTLGELLALMLGNRDHLEDGK